MKVCTYSETHTFKSVFCLSNFISQMSYAILISLTFSQLCAKYRKLSESNELKKKNKPTESHVRSA